MCRSIWPGEKLPVYSFRRRTYVAAAQLSEPLVFAVAVSRLVLLPKPPALENTVQVQICSFTPFWAQKPLN
jgi:hypothetical protein